MADVWRNAEDNARPDCPKCHGTGQYVYTTHGTPHSTICGDCCAHNMGWWLLGEGYGDDAGKWCCRAGCGHTVAEKPVGG